MRRVHFLSGFLALLLIAVADGQAWGLGSEDFGNGPLAEAGYQEWKGIVPVVNDKCRVYQNWVNGNEHFFYVGQTKDVNAALAHFAKVEVDHHVVVLRHGPANTQSFQGTVVPYNWQLHVIGGIAKIKAVDDVTDLDWQEDPVMTIYLGDSIELKSLEFPRSLTLAVRKEDEKQQELVDFVSQWNEKHKAKQ